MTAYRKRPVVIEAWQWGNGNHIDYAPPWMQDAVTKGTVSVFADHDEGLYLTIKTLEGVMRANPGDWIIKGVAGEFYPIKASIFATTYDLAGDDETPD